MDPDPATRRMRKKNNKMTTKKWQTMYLKKGNEMPTKQQKIHRKTPEKLLKTDLKIFNNPQSLLIFFYQKESPFAGLL